MVIHYQPERLRYNSDQPTAITDVLVATSGSSSRTGEIPLGTPTCSARTRQGRWALYPNGDQVVVVWPGGALVGPAVEVAQELDRLGDGQDDLDRAAVRAIRQFLTDPAAADGARWSATRARTWSSPAVATGSAAPPTSPNPATTPRPAGPAHRHLCHTHRSRCPTPAQSRHHHEPPDAQPSRTPTHSDPPHRRLQDSLVRSVRSVRVIASVPRAGRICSVSGSRTWSRPSCSTRGSPRSRPTTS